MTDGDLTVGREATRVSARPRTVSGAQRLREKRLLTGLVSYGLALAVVVGAWLLGFYGVRVVVCVVAMIVPINLGLFALLRTGQNLRFRDPNITLLQLCLASVPMLYAAYHAGPARGAFLVLTLSVTMYGLFSFRTRDFIYFTIFILLGYSTVIGVMVWREPEGLQPRVDSLQWFAVLVAMAQFSSLAGYVNQLRGRLRARHLELAERNEELERALERIREMAMRDELTGAYNRRYLAEAIALEKKRCEREGGDFSFAILDIDFFKQVNDTHGHLIGDEVLKGVAEVLRRELRETDLFGRWGGEEFAVLLVGADIDDARAIVERILRALAAHRFPAGEGALHVTASAGITAYRSPEHPDRTFARADQALYRAKEGGRDRLEIGT
ncbi:MAG: GGDEF domain-containing protein [Polyangiales bacterium]